MISRSNTSFYEITMATDQARSLVYLMLSMIIPKLT